MKILTAKQFYKADKVTLEKQQITAEVLMERAATLCFQWLDERLQGNPIKIHVFCGSGNNGGDGLVIARHLHQYGYHVQCYIVNYKEGRTPAFLEHYKRLKDTGLWPVTINSEDDFPTVAFEDIIIDAIFGLGLKRSPSGFTKALIQNLNATKAWILAIDFPSGLYGNKPVTDKEAVIKAGHTLTFQAPKIAFFLPQSQDFINTWEVLDIGLDQEFLESQQTVYYFLQKKDIIPLYKPRKRFSHKGDYGHSLIIGGSFGKIGAVTLTTKAALKIGSGLVTAYIPKCGYQIVQVAVPEAMVEVDADNFLEHFNYKAKASVIGIGVGFGTSDKTIKGFEKFLKENTLPLVLDADAINCISKKKSLLKLIPSQSVLTPHIKEFERLVGSWKDDFEKLEKLIAFTKKHKVIVVLKDAYTMISNDGAIYFNNTGNPALATAGSGDVLTGIITGLIAQQYNALEAAFFGVYLHGKTADLAMNQMAVETFTASDILSYLPDAILDLFIEPKFEEVVEDPSDGDDIEEDGEHV